MELSGRTYLVTGGSSGLGAACVRECLHRGARVVLADIRPPDEAEFPEPLDGEPVACCLADVTRPADVESAIQFALQRFGSLQGAIHCAGILAAARLVGRDGPHDLELFRRVVEVNLVGTFNVMRLAARHMTANPPNHEGERGVIVVTSSVAAMEGQAGQVAYAASKGGVASMVLPAARDLATHGIRVVAIAPGVFETPMVRAAPEKVRVSLQSQTVFPRRLGQPDEFAQFVRAVIENPMLNGCLLRLDGAIRMGPA